MALNVEVSEQYVTFTLDSKTFSEKEQKNAEKEVIKQFNAGIPNYIFDLTKVDNLEESAINLFAKINRVCQRESGILLLVSKTDEVIDTVASLLEDGVVCLPTAHEATEAVFMHDLENELKGEEDEADMFGFGEAEEL
jgi:anti-anti-sigma regulatory factor